MTGHLLPTEGQRLPPPPMTSKEARALGLKAFPSFARCRVDGTNVRTTARGLCVACQEREKAARKARDKAVAEKVRAEVLKTARAAVLRELEAEEKQRQRDADKAAKEAEKAALKAQRQAEKEAQEKERRRQKAADTRARNKAAAAAQAVAPPADTVPPWEESPDFSSAAPAAATASVAEVSPDVPATSASSSKAPPWTEFADCLTFDDSDTSPWD